MYALTQQDAEASNIVVLGIQSIAQVYAYMLFDTGASHSIISSTFV